MKLLVISFLLMVIVCCKNQNSGSPNVVTQSTKDTVKEDEDVNSFLKQFKNDQKFRGLRSIDAVFLRYNIEQDKYDTLGRKLGEGLLDGLLSDRSLSIQTTGDKNSFQIEFLGDENGIKVLLHFSKIKSHWYLLKVEDLST